MNYRQFDKSALKISAVSMGVLQIPAAADPASIDGEQRAAALKYGVEHGINYINLGFPYLFAEPEKACAYVKKALGEICRDKVSLGVNIPASLVESQKDMDEYLDKQLNWYGLESADICIISGIYRANWPKLKKLELKQWLNKTIASGKAKLAGFSFHDEPHYITPINSYYPDWALMQVDYSFMDARHHPGDGGIGLAAKYGMCVAASECLKGNRLIQNIPESVQAVWDKAEEKRTPAQWAIKWAYNNGDVGTVQFEFASVAEAETYMAYAEGCKPESMSLEELICVRSAVAAYNAREFFACPACRCCMPCVNGVDAPRIGELYNEVCMFGDPKIPLFRYRIEGEDRHKCVNCGKCVTICPKKNPLPEAVARMAALAEA